MEKQCLKCQHVAQIQSLAEPCPNCGAIYEKVEAYLNQSAAPAHSQPKKTNKSAPIFRVSEQQQDREDYIAVLRSESLYPTTRWWVDIVYIIVCVIAALFCIGGVISAVMGKSFYPLSAVLLGAIIWLSARIAKELSIMGIDLCDAGVRSAYVQERGQSL